MSCLTPSRLVESTCVIDESLNSTSTNEKSATCLLQLTVEEPKSNEESEMKTKKFVLDLPPATLNTLLDGLTRIREQLSTVARK
ncbi:COMM domain-containing protein 9-like [Diprion similis]|uniref:COMM domain-containing protein 9-like n=1 Tax=Diprion similis TaxID=362088 RepID=UPI001EF98D8E|nr:COMM domain-containing protein 9-like [Diprion similis]